MSEIAPEPEEFVGRPPAGDESPDDYVSNDQSAGISEDTGTVYDATGEPEVTPHDEELVGADDEETS
jgi:hypothetical protein